MKAILIVNGHYINYVTKSKMIVAMLDSIIFRRFSISRISNPM